MKLNKTQTKLLERAANNVCGYVVIYHGFITSRRRGEYGGRDSEAAIKLRDAGLLRFVESHSSVHHLTHGFGADRGSETIFSITNEGRKALGA